MKALTSELLSGWDSVWWFAGASFLISECEDNVDQEHDAVNDRKRAFGDADGFSVVRCKADDFTDGGVVPILQDQDSRGDEQGASDQREENVWNDLEIKFSVGA